MQFEEISKLALYIEGESGVLAVEDGDGGFGDAIQEDANYVVG